MYKLQSGDVQPQTNVQWKVYSSCMSRLNNRLVAANRSEATIISYTRALGKLLSFHHFRSPGDIEIDDVIDFIAYLVEEKQINQDWWD